MIFISFVAMRTIIRIAKLQIPKKQLLGGKIMLDKFSSRLFRLKSKENDVMKEQRITEVPENKQLAKVTVVFFT